MSFFAYNILQKRDRAIQLVSLCSTGRLAAIEVHIIILRPSSDPKLTRPELGQNLTDLSGLTKACFAAF